MSDADPLVLPRGYVRVIRWAECVFIVPALAMLGFLPIPPHGAALWAFVTISSGILAAGVVWWGLRSPTRVAWYAAFILAGFWLVQWMSNAGTIVRAILTPGVAPAIVLSFVFASLPAVAQLVVLFAWLKATRTRTNAQ